MIYESKQQACMHISICMAPSSINTCCNIGWCFDLVICTKEKSSDTIQVTFAIPRLNEMVTDLVSSDKANATDRFSSRACEET